MKTINQYIIERLKISSDLNKKEYKYHPQTSDELQKLIITLYKKRGPNADLNDIDTSKITDMSYLFDDYNIKKNMNFDISQWDVSNVQDMAFMFFMCEKFNSDLSQWNIASVENISSMFEGCSSLKTYPKWYRK